MHIHVFFSAFFAVNVWRSQNINNCHCDPRKSWDVIFDASKKKETGIYIISNNIVGINIIHLYMGVSKNCGTPKWVVYNGKPYFLMGDLGVPSFSETPIYTFICNHFLKGCLFLIHFRFNPSVSGCPRADPLGSIVLLPRDPATHAISPVQWTTRINPTPRHQLNGNSHRNCF